MTTAFRTAKGGRIDRSQSIGFRFDGQNYWGNAGDTLASALLANGVHFVGRSFKYHRPRGIMTAGSEEPNALVQFGLGDRTEPNARATVVELHEGLVAASQNAWPTLGSDVGVVNSWASRLIPAGFYYKTFMWPRFGWKFYERAIRHAAGLGRAPEGKDPDHYDKMHAHCDVLVVGGGPAGLSAARAAAMTGARVIVMDEGPEFGGSLLSETAEIAGRPAMDWVAGVVDELAERSNVRLLTRTSAVGYYDHNFLVAVERVTDHLAAPPEHLPRQRLWKVRAKQVVLAQGAIERPLVFADNDRPGIMMAGAARSYLNRYGVKVGNRVVVATNNDSAYAAAADLHDAGVAVTIVDIRDEPTGGDLPLAAFGKGIDVLSGHAVIGSDGGRRVEAAYVAQISPSAKRIAGSIQRFECDAILMSGGWNPSVHLFSQSGGKLAYDRERTIFIPGETRQQARSTGAAAGDFSLVDALTDGLAAGLEAAADAGHRKRGGRPQAPAVAPVITVPLEPLWSVPGRDPRGRTNKHFVDFQNDVTAADVALAAREGYLSVEHLKRYTTTGMGTDQGKSSNVNALALMAAASGRDIPEVGTTTFRPPFVPVSFGALAGRNVDHLADPVRKTPMHRWHETAGAVFEDVGQWKRPFYYPQRGEGKQAAVNREVRAVRNSLGILDASTLGKIDIRGPDARKLLNWVYTNAWNKLEAGRCRYGLMCHEDGMVFDDGVTACLDENHFLMHTTTGNAASVLGWIEEWLQTEWPNLKVWCTSVTEQFATVTICGPNARRLLGELCGDIDLSSEAFPFMSVREGHVAGLRARVFRVSFTGELSYEINVSADCGLALWNACMMAGEKFGITPFGTEAMHVLRAEKGYIIVGQDTDGTVTPIDLGMGWAVSATKDFLGKRSLARAATAAPGRKELVGLMTETPTDVLPEGAQIVEKALESAPMPMLGHVTSSYYSPNLGHSIALALVRDGRNRIGETLEVPLPERTCRVRLTDPVFFDKEGARLDG
ncbi:sarcosine oxidase subunit alpha [Oceanibacterium hippocampi]|uniref:Aminomethyltransferase n=1 Tax=Oceanibacterium hippocampi TaxID=745714 RepID=A0A1Y5SMD5_9PROT|nr:sarcosine oxidase subunit alpha [Oceanibacterium hippocampi]SLN43488.1 Aminomethyltransferase [Oceanibacterium hippocampi]